MLLRAEKIEKLLADFFGGHGYEWRMPNLEWRMGVPFAIINMSWIGQRTEINGHIVALSLRCSAAPSLRHIVAQPVH